MTLIVHTVTAITAVFVFVIKANTAKDTLRLGVLIPMEGDLDLSAYILPMNLALETIENDTTLPFKFTTKLNDSMVCVKLNLLHYSLRIANIASYALWL